MTLVQRDNRLGADGAKEVADMLYFNNSLQLVDLSNVDIVSDDSEVHVHIAALQLL